MQEMMELEQLLEELTKRGFRPVGIIFSDPKFGLLGIAPVAGVPDDFVQMIGQRLSGAPAGTSWSALGSA